MKFGYLYKDRSCRKYIYLGAQVCKDWKYDLNRYNCLKL